jgi:FKBP-type peptidyl-prolyl cis-trans isomerase
MSSALAVTVVSLVSLVGPPDDKGKGRPLETEKDKVSYAMAVAVARGIQRQGVEVDPEIFARGLADALSARKLLMSEQEVREAVTRANPTSNRATAGNAMVRQAAGQAFRAENAKKDGVVTLPNGVQYKILKKGKGERPSEGDTVVCHYRGTSIEGKEFESSYRQGKPARLSLSRVIPGWKEALKLMPVGSTWQVVVPPELAYRAQPRGKRTKVQTSSETLVFEIELLAVDHGRAAATRTATVGSYTMD